MGGTTDEIALCSTNLGSSAPFDWATEGQSVPISEVSSRTLFSELENRDFSEWEREKGEGKYAARPDFEDFTGILMALQVMENGL